MNSAINTHDFEAAKQAIEQFSKQTPTDLSLTYVNEKKGVGEWLGDALFGGGLKSEHTVTGKELNNLTVQIQAHFKVINSTEIKLIQEFRQVYCALQALDKDYIQWIVDAILAVKETSTKIDKHQNQIDEIQNDQKESLDTLFSLLQELMGFKQDLEDKILPGLYHNVSYIQAANQKNTTAISINSQLLNDSNRDIQQLSDSLGEQIGHIEDLISFVGNMKAITHLREIDQMWDSLSSAHASLNDIYEKMKSTKAVADKQQQDIQQALDFIDTMSQYKHLKDIDAIWGNVEEHGEKLNALVKQHQETDNAVAQNHYAIVELNGYKQELSSIVHLKDIDTTWKNVDDHGKKLTTLKEEAQKTDEAVSQNKKAIAELNRGLSDIAHLKDVDSLWLSNETHSDEIKELQDLGEDARKLIRQNKDLADQSLADEKSRIDTVVQNLNKKIQYAYWIAGGSMALALIELFVILLG